jgi:hypothetical protein
MTGHELGRLTFSWLNIITRSIVAVWLRRLSQTRPVAFYATPRQYPTDAKGRLLVPVKREHSGAGRGSTSFMGWRITTSQSVSALLSVFS